MAHRPLPGVRERDERDRVKPVRGRHRAVEARERGQQRAVAVHDALRRAGRAGRVHEGEAVVREHGSRGLFEIEAGGGWELSERGHAGQYFGGEVPAQPTWDPVSGSYTFANVAPPVRALSEFDEPHSTGYGGAQALSA